MRLIELMEKSCVSNDHCNEIMLLMRTRTVNREKARWRTEIVEYCRKDEFCSVVFLCKWRCLYLRNDFVRISDEPWVVSRAKNVGRLSWISFVFSASQWWKDVNGKANDFVKIILAWRVAERNELEMESK